MKMNESLVLMHEIFSAISKITRIKVSKYDRISI